MGDVYVGRDVRLDREIALKFISVEYAENETWERRFLREAKAASRLTHPNLVVICEVGEWQGTKFLAMEHVKRETLSHRLKRGRSAVRVLDRSDHGNGVPAISQDDFLAGAYGVDSP